MAGGQGRMAAHNLGGDLSCLAAHGYLAYLAYQPVSRLWAYPARRGGVCDTPGPPPR
jgi:hypothetical protein